MALLDQAVEQLLQVAHLAQRAFRLAGQAPGFGADIIRITPARIVAWNLDRPGYNSRFVP